VISGESGITLRLELELEGDALSGQIIDPDGIEYPFTGRIGLVGVIEELIDGSRRRSS
jgi:hypothetical protein